MSLVLNFTKFFILLSTLLNGLKSNGQAKNWTWVANAYARLSFEDFLGSKKKKASKRNKK